MAEGGYLQELNALDSAIGALHQLPLSCVPAVQLADVACRLRVLAGRLESLETRVVAAASEAAEGPGVFKALGFRHAIDYVVDGTGVAASEVRRLNRTGVWLLDFPVFAEAFAEGVLSHRHVDELRGLHKPKVHHQLVESQQMLVDAARDLNFVDFVNVCAYWLNAADPDGDEPVEQAVRSGLSYKKHSDGSVSGRFLFDALAGQAFRNLLDQETQRLFRQDTQHGEQRSQGSRHGTALLNLMTRGSAKGGNSQITPLINIVLGETLAENLVTRMLDDTTEIVEPDYHDLERRCELIDGTPIHPKFAMAVMAAAVFRRVVFDEHSHPTEVAVTARNFPGWMRQILLIRARGRCQIPGCDSPFAWLQADHVQPHSKGGPTKLSNGQILCDPHNKWKRDT